eukprot:scaffold6.g2506.t1
MASAQLIDGKAVAEEIRRELKAEVAELKQRFGKASAIARAVKAAQPDQPPAGLPARTLCSASVPGLAVVLVGQRKDSQTYVRNKKKACDEVGIVSFGTDLPEDASEEEVLKVVADYNANPAVHGILVQLPLPKHINEQRILDAISIEKDVDGFHPINIGCLAMRGRQPLFVPCTPRGCLELLKRSGVRIFGTKAAVVGRSNITPDAAAICAEADIVIAACGKAEMIGGDWIKPGAAVIDVGINAVDDPNAKRGYRLVGDVNFEEAKAKAAFITPVPGGVGPMTIATLLRNCVDGAKRTLEAAQ